MKTGADEDCGIVLENVCAAIDDSDTVLVVVSQRTLDRIAGKNGALDPLKKAFEYAERTKGAESLLPAVIDPSVRSARDWWGGVGMVLGSRPVSDLTQEMSDPNWEGALHTLLGLLTLALLIPSALLGLRTLSLLIPSALLGLRTLSLFVPSALLTLLGRAQMIMPQPI